MKKSELTAKMWQVLEFAQRSQGGQVCAGASVENGHVVRINASVLRGLARRGFLTLHIHPDGGMMGSLTGSAIIMLNNRKAITAYREQKAVAS